MLMIYGSDRVVTACSLLCGVGAIILLYCLAAP